MELDSRFEPILFSPQERILQRLRECGVGEEYVIQLQPGLIDYVKENKSKLHEIVYAILSADTEYNLAAASEYEYSESMNWLRWLMFEDEPQASLEALEESSAHQKRGVCGAVWGKNDIAYRCRTCEHDPTCVICVSCFQNGNHKDHDYSLIYTGSGCCDCGDVTAWKPEGFCSNHNGSEEIQPLSEEIASSVGPVLDVIFIYWKEKLVFSYQSSSVGIDEESLLKVCNDLTNSVVEMLHEFCLLSGSMISFVSRRVLLSTGLLDVLVRAEKFLSVNVVKKTHELLLKLVVGEPTFKYEFSKVFIKYYPESIKVAIEEGSDNILHKEKYPLLSTFAVQLFTVPTLTTRLVKEMNLLDMLLRCVVDVFSDCLAEKGDNIEVDKWVSLFKTTLRMVEDIRQVMSHAEVLKYITHDQPDISQTWIQLLAFVQGMNPQRRVTGLHVEEESQHTHMPFVLGHYIANIHSLLVVGAFSGLKDDIDYNGGLSSAKVGKPCKEITVCSTKGKHIVVEGEGDLYVPSSAMWLTDECLKAIENWLGSNSVSIDSHNFLSQDTFSYRYRSSFLALKKTLSRMNKRKSMSKVYGTHSVKTRLNVSKKRRGRIGPFPSRSGFSKHSLIGSQHTSLVGTGEMDVEYGLPCRAPDENNYETACRSESESSGVLSLSDWPDICYDVSSQDISFHIPLHRLLAMLLQKILKEYVVGLKASDVIHSVSDHPSSGGFNDFFDWILGGYHPVGFSAFLMEHPLQIRVFCAQVRAGMWRKNGDEPMLSCECYRSRRSEQGLELDLFLLQCCAALAPPDLYVQRILDRFGLSNYLSLSLEWYNEHESVLVQDMLTLIIQIVKERRFCGSSTSETLRRELVYKLAKTDATHSQLVESLPCDISKNDQLQDILDTVAVYANPSEMKQGKYSLRKEYWGELDLYHPRWNSRSLQIAEERYQWFCKVSPLTAQLPRWTNVLHPLYGISRIATCKKVLEIIRAVLFYAVCMDEPSSSRAPDEVLFTALHLLSLALDICHVQSASAEKLCKADSLPVLSFAGEEVEVEVTNKSDTSKPQSLLSLLVSLMIRYSTESLNKSQEAGQSDLYSMIRNLLKRVAELDVSCMTKLKTLSPEVISHLWPPIINTDYHTSGSTSNGEDRKAKAREQQAAILEKMRAAQSKFMESLKLTSNEEADVAMPEQEDYVSDEESISEESLVCSLCRDSNSKSPVSFMIFLQKSRLVSFAERGPPSWEQIFILDKQGKSKSKNESEADESSSYALPGDFDSFLDSMRAQLPTSKHIQLPSRPYDETVDKSSIEKLEDNICKSILKGMQDRLLQSTDLKDFPSNSSSPDENYLHGSRNGQSILLGKYVASLSRETSEQPWIARVVDALSKTCVQFASFDGFGPINCDGIYISSCGHAVHQDCHDRYLSSVRERYNRRMVFEGGHVVDPDQGEFLCPVCRRLGNSVLPTGACSQFKEQKMLLGSSSEADTHSLTTSGAHVLRLAKALSLLRSAASTVAKGEVLQVFSSLQNERMQRNLEPVFHRLCRMYFHDRCDTFLESGRVSHSMIFWDTIRYSLISTEIAARGGKSTLSTGNPVSRIGALNRELDSSSGFILPFLLQVVQNTGSEDCLQVLLRFRGIQLFTDSICSGVSVNQSSIYAGSQQGNFSSMLKHAEKGISYPDIQFWKRSADPVLTHDPFSSLMWILFALPRPFLYSTESFLSLVHLLYSVCVVQALITCCGHSQLDLTKLGSDDCLIGYIPKILGNSVAAQHFFVSHCIDSSSHPKDVIRRLSHPYLRRCALLWKLLKSPVSASICDKFHQWDVPSVNLSNATLESTTALTMELKELEELENMFQIPDLEIILKNKDVHAISLKWLRHFCEDPAVSQREQVLHLTPAIPFQLMRLPILYQNLLERYIKQQCPGCNAMVPYPALCLLCGRLCSSGMELCCRGNDCHTHAMSCGSGIGVFLLIRKTTILLHRSTRADHWPSPYLDAFGEEDIGMQRGKPLYLSEERYTVLTHMVASHGVDHSSGVLD